MKLWEMVNKYGSCGCRPLRVQCEVCQKLLCGTNGAHTMRLTVKGIEAANGQRKLCIECGLKVRRASERTINGLKR